MRTEGGTMVSSLYFYESQMEDVDDSEPKSPQHNKDEQPDFSLRFYESQVEDVDESMPKSPQPNKDVTFYMDSPQKGS